MQKSGLKSFIFSFFLALCAVVTVDKAVLHTPKEPKPVKNISYKNIALFSDKQDDVIVASATISSNKIAQIAKEADDLETENLAENISQTPSIEEIVEKNIESVEEKDVAFVYNPEEDFSTNTELPDEISFAEIVARSETLPSVEDDEKSGNTNIGSEEQTENVFSASAADDDVETQIADTSFDENINLWLPIEKGTTNIDIAGESILSQVAMSGNDVMLSSILEEEKADTEQLSDAISVAKTAESTDYISPEQEEDSPWLVAKGAKFTKNHNPVALAKSTKNESSKDLETAPDAAANSEGFDQDTQSLGEEFANNVQETNESSLPLSEKQQNEILATSEGYTIKKEDVVSDQVFISPEDTNYYEQGFANEEPLNEETSVEEKPQFSLNRLTSDKEIKAVSGILTRYPEEKPEGSVDVAYKVMQNILIPVPEDILENDNLVPQLEESDEPEEQKSKKASAKKIKKEKEKGGILKSISSFFGGSDKKKKTKAYYEEYDVGDDEEIDEEDTQEQDEELIDEEKKKKSKKKKEILPTEMRLSFQPEKAEISGTTLRWLRAFAETAKNDPDTYIEIRIDGSGAFALQQKRLNLLQGVFSDNGLDSSKIDIVFTSREPNSFIIRSLKTTKTEVKETKKKEIKPYYQNW